jgi:outer membrane protein OmpA-like peptidoglycan-associated protein
MSHFLALGLSRTRIVAFLSICMMITGQAGSAAGLNSENLVPALDNHSALMWETNRVQPAGSTLWAYTFSYLLRPVEFGDGKDERLPVSDHLQINHLGASYGVTRSLQIGISLPLAFYSNPKSQSYLISAGSAGRKSLFLGDPLVRAKWSLFPGERLGFGFGVLGEIGLPLGSTEAMLSDDAFIARMHLLLHYAFNAGFEVYLNPGYGIWSNDDRVVAQDPDTGERFVLVSKPNAVFLQSGLRYWLTGYARRANSIQLEAGVRGEFANAKLALNDRASPVEWSAGALYFLSRDLSLHGAYGAGIGSGVTAPLSRLWAGVRYVQGTRPAFEETTNVAQTGVTSEAYSDDELDLIFEEAQAEQMPQSRANLETLLRLKTQYGILDIGSVNFEFDSSQLTAKAKETIRRLYEELQRIDPKSIKIDGHTDSVGAYEYNLALSKRRANSVMNELIRLGIRKSIVSTEGFSFKYPMTSNATVAGRSQNRRIEVSVDGLSFRKTEYSREEIELFRRWIYPDGKTVDIKMNKPELDNN